MPVVHYRLSKTQIANRKLQLWRFFQYITCLAFERPFVSRCLAAIQRMWSSKINLAVRRGKGLARCDEAGLCILMCKHLLSSLSPVTSTSYNSATVQLKQCCPHCVPLCFCVIQQCQQCVSVSRPHALHNLMQSVK